VLEDTRVQQQVSERRKWRCTDEERDGGEDSVELGSGEFRSGESFVEGRAEVCAVDLSSAVLPIQ